VVETTWWHYLIVFLAVMASWAGVPFVGATAATGAAVAASQGYLNLAAVLLVVAVAGEIGGIIGYGIGFRWGRRLLERPGKRQEWRQRWMEKGEQAYAKWGRLAVFVTPAIVSGTAKMHYRQFVVWNFFAALLFAISIGLSAYGLSRLLTGHQTAVDVLLLVVGLTLTTVLVVIGRRHRKARAAESPG
jgi:membrane protein DedA with SNARE-associated domain